MCTATVVAHGSAKHMVRIRLYDQAGTRAGQLRQALLTAEHALATGGVEPLWIAFFSADDGQESACQTKPDEGRELILRLVATAPSATPRSPLPDSLAYSMVDRVAARGTFATVYVDRVDAMAAGAGASSGTLLGRATHTKSGICSSERRMRLQD